MSRAAEPKMTREEFIALRKADMDEFMEGWQAERQKHDDGFVPVRMMGITGIIARELEQAGMIVGDGCGNYRPVRRR